MTISAFYLLFLIFIFWRVCIPLFERDGAKSWTIPFLIGAITGAKCVPECVCVKWFVNVLVCMRAGMEWLFLYSMIHFFKFHPDALQRTQTQLYWYFFLLFFSFFIPPLTPEFAVYVDKYKKCRTYDVGITRTWFFQISFKSEELSFLPQCWGAACVLWYSVWRPPFDLDKKAWGSPLEILCGYNITS